MAIAAVQRNIKGTVASSISIGSGDGWATPTSGNLLVASVNSDATVTMSGWTAGPSVVDGNGAYIFYKVSAGTESTVTATPSGSSDIVLSVAEYSGTTATPFDVSNSSTIAGSSGTTTTSTSVTTTASADLIIAVAALHSLPGAVPSGDAWANSFVDVLSGYSGATSASTHQCFTFVAELLPAGAVGAYSTSASWSGPAVNRQQLIIAFKAAAGGGAPAYPPIQPARRRLVAKPPRARIATAAQPQTGPPATLAVVKPFRPARGLLPRRGRSFAPTPAQVVVAAPAIAPRPVRIRPKGLRLFRGRVFTPVPAQVVIVPPLYPPQNVRTRVRGLRLFRGRAATPVPAQVVVTPPAYPVQSVRTRLRGLRIFRGRAATVVPPQIVVTPPSFTPLAVRTRLRFARIFRGRTAAPVPDQLAAPPAPHLRTRGMAPRRGHAAMPVPPQTVVAPPAYPVRPVRSRLKGLRGARGRQAAMPVPPQVVIVPPKVVPLFARLKQHAARIFRGESRAILPPVCDCTTHRPNLGTTARPSSGMTSRPDSGTTSRPCSCND